MTKNTPIPYPEPHTDIEIARHPAKYHLEKLIGIVEANKILSDSNLLPIILDIPEKMWKDEALTVARWLLEKLEGPAADISPIRTKTHDAALAA